MMTLFPRTIGPIPIDAVITETLESRLRITELPVEFGADITDHAYIEPMRITIEGIIGGGMKGRSTGGRAIAVAAWQALKQLQQSRTPFTLISGLDIHRNILIESLIPERDKDYSWVLKFTAELREIQIVSSAYTEGSAAAPKNGQARGLSSSKAAPGDTAIKASPVAQRGDVPMSASAAARGAVPAASNSGSILYGLAQ